jgi:hypothetical protein
LHGLDAYRHGTPDRERIRDRHRRGSLGERIAAANTTVAANIFARFDMLLLHRSCRLATIIRHRCRPIGAPANVIGRNEWSDLAPAVMAGLVSASRNLVLFENEIAVRPTNRRCGPLVK